MIATEKAAEALLNEHETRQHFHSIRTDYPFDDLGTAYAIQDRVVSRLRTKNDARIAGYKIGLTSLRMQEMCGIPHPIAGHVLQNRVHQSGYAVSVSDFVHIGIECEIAVRIGRDLTDSGPISADALASAISGVAPAFELVEDRHADYKSLDMLTLVADNSWNAGIVLGEFQSAWPDLAAIEGVLTFDGHEIDHGFGRDVMGHPLEPLAWLCRHLWSRGEMLHAGDILMTGSMTPTRFPSAGQHYKFSLSGLGTVETIFKA